MSNSTAVMELVGNYSTYADVELLSVDAAADAPASTWACVTYFVGSNAVTQIVTNSYYNTC